MILNTVRAKENHSLLFNMRNPLMHVVKYVKQSSLILKTERKNIERMRQVARPVLPYPPLLFELSFILSLCAFSSTQWQAHSFSHSILCSPLFLSSLLDSASSLFSSQTDHHWLDPPTLTPSSTYSHTHTHVVSTSHTLHSAAAMLMNLRNREMGKWQGIIGTTNNKLRWQSCEISK